MYWYNLIPTMLFWIVYIMQCMTSKMKALERCVASSNKFLQHTVVNGRWPISTWDKRAFFAGRMPQSSIAAYCSTSFQLCLFIDATGYRASFSLWWFVCKDLKSLIILPRLSLWDSSWQPPRIGYTHCSAALTKPSWSLQIIPILGSHAVKACHVIWLANDAPLPTCVMMLLGVVWCLQTSISLASIGSSGITGCMPLASQKARKLSQHLENSKKAHSLSMLKAGGKCSGGGMNSCIPQNMLWHALSKTSWKPLAKSASYFRLRRQPRWHTRKEAHGRLLWMCQSRAFSLLLFSTSNKTRILQGQNSYFTAII